MSCLADSSRRFAGGEDGWSAIYWTFRLKSPSLGTPDEQIRRAADWVSVSPRSVFARFAKLRVVYDDAWIQRGGALARDTAEDKFRIFHFLLSDLETRLEAADADVRDTPLWANLMLATLLDEQRPRRDPAAVFVAGVRRWPRYYDFYEVMVSRLLPRWGGSWPAVESFIGKSSASLAATDGDSLYARLYVAVFNARYSPDETSLNSDRMRTSLRDWLARYPSVENLNLIASTACLLNDGPLFREAYGRLAVNEVTPSTWYRQIQRNECVARFIK